MKQLKTLFCIAFIAFFVPRAGAQNISMEETLAYINGKLTGSYIIDVKRGKLLVESYMDGKKMMNATAFITDLKQNVVYSEEEKAFVFKCIDGDKCVERIEYLVEKKNYFSRVIVTTPDDKSVQGLQKAFQHLINLVYDPKYKNAEPFE